MTGKSHNCFHSSNIISNVRSCGDCLRRKLKIKGDKVDGCCSSVKRWSRFIFTLKICLLEIPQISLIIIAKKIFVILLGFRASMTHLLIVITTLESLFSWVVFRKEFSIFLSTMSEKQEITISDSVYRIDSI